MKSTRNLPSKEYLEECFTYDPETGLLYWKNRPLNHFESEHSYKIWNSRFSNKLALNHLNTSTGYLCGQLNGKPVKTHRVIYKLVYGTDPNIILHENGNKTDNRIEKLSSGTRSENGKDQKKHVTNLSGISGVCWYKNYNKWLAFINVEHKRKHLGYFENFFEACCARKSAEVKYCYHLDHGKR